MRSRALATRLIDAAIVALVMLMLGLAATAPRAEREASTWPVTVVAAPPVPCEAAGTFRDACLIAARTTALTR